MSSTVISRELLFERFPYLFGFMKEAIFQKRRLCKKCKQMVFGLSKKSKKEVIYEEMISAIVVVEEKERAFQTPGRKRVRIYVSRSCVCTEDQD